MVDSRISWDQYYMLQAKIISLRSTCNKMDVGAIITKDNHIVSSGYNGSVAGTEHCLDKGCYLVDGKCIRTIHAEINAIMQSAKQGISTEQSSIYITHFPCVNCTKQIIQAGISKVYYEQNHKNSPLAIELFKEVNVKVIYEPIKDLSILEKLGG